MPTPLAFRHRIVHTAPMMSIRGALAVVAALVAAVGIWVGATPHTINDHDPVGVVNCGSALITSAQPASFDLGAAAAGATTTYEAQCSQTLANPRTAAVLLVGLGSLSLLILNLTRPKSQPSPRSEDVRTAS